MASFKILGFDYVWPCRLDLVSHFVFVHTYVLSCIGFFCATLYHFFVHDQTGPIGTVLRKAIHTMPMFGLDDRTFCTVFIGIFMQIIGILQLGFFFGPGFSPFNRTYNLLERIIFRAEITVDVKVDTSSGAVNAISTRKRTRKRRKRKKNANKQNTNGPVTTYTNGGVELNKKVQ